MIINMTAGGNAPKLNFSVVGGAAAPASPAENTIWVNTTTAITGYTFAAQAPQSPAAGMVWIQTGASSSVAFPATKDNPILVYPLTAQQYISGAWVNKTAKSWQGGAWVDWSVYYFDFGRQAYKWQTRAVPFGEYRNSNGTGTLTVNSDGSVTYGIVDNNTDPGSRQRSGVYELASDVDLTSIKTLHFDIDATFATYYSSGLCVYKRDAANPLSNAAAHVVLNSGMDLSGGVDLDVSALTGSWCIGMGVSNGYGNSSGVNLTITMRSLTGLM